MPKLSIKKSVVKTPDLEVVYPELEVRMFHSSPAVMASWERTKKSEASPLTGDVAKELLGWCTEKELLDMQLDLLSPEERKGMDSDNLVVGGGVQPLLNLNDENIYCRYNLDNRPYRSQAANDYMLETLRKKWRFNGETIIVDKYGRVHDGQHRLVGLLLAIDEWQKDKDLPKDDQLWQKIWPKEPYLESLVVLGIEGDDETVNTIGTGVKRTLEDVLYRSEHFQGTTNVRKKELAKVANWAIKLVWDRTAQKDASYAPRRPHSESMDFISRHERLLQCVRYVHDEDRGKLEPFIPLGYAAGLMYLMSTATSDIDMYNTLNSEQGLDFKLFTKAKAFWSDMARNGKDTEVVRELLMDTPVTWGGSLRKDYLCSTCIRAWNLYSDGKKLTKSNCQIEWSENQEGWPVLHESPRIGGIDLSYEPLPKEEVKLAADKKAKTSKGSGDGPNPQNVDKSTKDKCAKGGEHVWIEDEGEEFCEKCLEPKTVQRKRAR